MKHGEVGFVLHCHRDGRIARILNDTSGLLGDEWVGRPFTTLIAPGALAKALEFFTRVASQGAQYYWEMPVVPDDRAMVFIGARVEDAIAVAASTTPDGLDGFVSELVLVGNEQANMIRAMAAEKARGAAGDDGALEELTRLNIEFANMQRELARKNVELARANERKGLMIGMAAHDLRNPLQVVSGFAEHLRMRAADRLDDGELRFLGHILQSSARMLAIIEDVLVLSRSETGKLVLNREPVALAELVRDVAGLQASIAQTKEIAIAVDILRDPGGIEADGAKLRQVLDNLITNAIKFSMPRTRVEVRLDADDAQVVIEVADQGQGIPQAELPRLFQPFSRTSVRSTAGEPSTGLGLAISRNIVEGHGGRIDVTSVEGRGSCFRVRLPRHDAAASRLAGEGGG